MPAVLCGLKCFDLPVDATAGGVASEFTASLNPALNGAGCPVEVYRLESLAPDAQLSADDLVVCSVPGWQFDLAAVEELQRQLEELRLEHENLLVQYSRTKEVLISLNSSVEATEIDASVQRRPASGADGLRGNRKEVEQLKMQLTQSEKKQQETKATVMALRNEFMQLVDMMTGDSGGPKTFELPSVMKELDTNVREPWSQATHSLQYSPCETDRPGTGGTAPSSDAGKPRHVSQPPTVPGARRPIGSPRVYRSPGTYTTPRSAARPRGVHQRSGHSAGASMRQRQGDGL